MSDTTEKLKAVYDAYAGKGKKEGMEVFKSTDFLTFVRDSGLKMDKGNKFNSKPPNRVDFVFTYSCTNGPGGCKGNKTMTFDQFTYALKGIAKETGLDIETVTEKAANTTLVLEGATKAGANRFHDDTSNYTGMHRGAHGGDVTATKSEIRRNRTAKSLTGDEQMQYMLLNNAIETLFCTHDKDASGALNSTEVTEMLKALKPNASEAVIEFMRDEFIECDANSDGLVTLDEFKSAYNVLMDVIETIGDDDVGSVDKKKLIQKKYLEFCKVAAGSGDPEFMDSVCWKKFCMDCFPSTFPSSQQGLADIDLIFADMIREVRNRKKDVKGNRIEFRDFYSDGLLGIVNLIKKKGKKITMQDVYARILKVEVIHKQATEADSVRFHDDKSSYTGMHASVHGVDKQRTIAKANW